MVHRHCPTLFTMKTPTIRTYYYTILWRNDTLKAHLSTILQTEHLQRTHFCSQIVTYLQHVSVYSWLLSAILPYKHWLESSIFLKNKSINHFMCVSYTIYVSIYVGRHSMANSTMSVLAQCFSMQPDKSKNCSNAICLGCWHIDIILPIYAMASAYNMFFGTHWKLFKSWDTCTMY